MFIASRIAWMWLGAENTQVTAFWGGSDVYCLSIAWMWLAAENGQSSSFLGGHWCLLPLELLGGDLRQRTPKLPLFWEGIDVFYLSNYLEVTWSGKHPSYLFFEGELRYIASWIAWMWLAAENTQVTSFLGGHWCLLPLELLGGDLWQRTPKLPLFWEDRVWRVEGVELTELADCLNVTWNRKHPSYSLYRCHSKLR